MDLLKVRLVRSVMKDPLVAVFGVMRFASSLGMLGRERLCQN